MIELNRQYGEKMRFLAINIAVGDTPDTIRKFMKKVPGELTVLYDGKKEVAHRFKVFATPHIVLIDKKGDIVAITHSIDIEDIRSLLGDSTGS